MEVLSLSHSANNTAVMLRWLIEAELNFALLDHNL
jgi:hypothetical protein